MCNIERVGRTGAVVKYVHSVALRRGRSVLVSIYSTIFHKIINCLSGYCIVCSSVAIQQLKGLVQGGGSSTLSNLWQIEQNNVLKIQFSTKWKKIVSLVLRYGVSNTTDENTHKCVHSGTCNRVLNFRAAFVLFQSK